MENAGSRFKGVLESEEVEDAIDDRRCNGLGWFKGGCGQDGDKIDGESRLLDIILEKL